MIREVIQEIFQDVMRDLIVEPSHPTFAGFLLEDGSQFLLEDGGNFDIEGI